MNIIKGSLAIALTKFIFLYLSFIGLAQSAFMVEPGIKLYSGEFKVAERTGEFTGKVANLNLGYMDKNFMVGITLEKGDYEYDSEVTEDGYEKFDGGGVGTYIGFIFFDRIRVWTNYLNSTLEPKSNSDIRYFGQNFTYGLGYRVYDGLLINYQFFSNHFTQKEDDTTGKTEGLLSNIKTQGTSLSLSFILVF